MPAHSQVQIIFCIPTAGKKRKGRNELTEWIQCMRELDKYNDEKHEEREMKRRKFELELEEKRQQAEWEMEERRWEAEQKHEERMNYMFMSFMKEMMGRPSTSDAGHSSDQLQPSSYPRPMGHPGDHHGPRPHPSHEQCTHPSEHAFSHVECEDYYLHNWYKLPISVDLLQRNLMTYICIYITATN